MKIINSITSSIFNEMMIRQLAVGKGFFKRLFWRRYIKKYSTMIPMAYKE